MKNMKVSVKLIVSFLIIAVFALLVGIAGIFGLRQMDAQANTIYEKQMLPLSDLSQLTTLLQRMRVNMREYTIGIAEDNPARISAAYTAMADLNASMTNHFDAYGPTIVVEEAKILFNEARALFDGDYQTYLQQSYDAALAGDLSQSLQILDAAKADTTEIVDKLDQCSELRMRTASRVSAEGTALGNTLLWVIIGALILAVAIAILLAFYISSLISKPLAPLTEFMKQAGGTGDLNIAQEQFEQLSAYAAAKDEIGQTIAASAAFVERVKAVSKVLETVADGDLTVALEALSTKDTLGLSLNKMITNLGQMFGDIHSATEQVSSGSRQIADGAQALAQGSTEQAASVQELSSSITEIASRTQENAEMAERAANLSRTIMGSVEKGSRQMDDLMTAVEGINEASRNISRIIKTIDDIAFQTNILALNAAVEAARAGQHGKGFAVVAEEVRNLASKSAEAAKETSGMIQNSMEKAELGTRMARETASSLTEIVTGINESTDLITDIAKSSEEQSLGISQINIGIDQVSQVVQQNSATAQESAAASEEMSSQSNLLEELISQFKLDDSGQNSGALPAKSPRRMLSGPAKSPSSGNFGKY